MLSKSTRIVNTATWIYNMMWEGNGFTITRFLPYEYPETLETLASNVPLQDGQATFEKMLNN